VFDDSYSFSKYFEEDEFYLPSKVSVQNSLEVVNVVCSRSSYRLQSIQPDLEGGVLICFDNSFSIQVSSQGTIFPSKNNQACVQYFTLQEFKDRYEQN
jgi:hypothetical protein